MRRLQMLVLAVLVLAAFALRLYRLDFQDIWWDEARNIDVSSRPLAQIATAGELDIHPPLYFYLLHGWWRLTSHASTPGGQDAFAVRFLSLWFGVLLVALMYALGRRVGGFWAGLGAALGAAFLPFLLGEAQEARMYTVLLAWLAGAAHALLAAVRDGHSGSERGGSGTRPYWLSFGLFSALALLTHYAAVFALVALWGWAGLWAVAGGQDGSETRPCGQRLRMVLLAGLVMALLCLPALPIALRQIPSYRNPNLAVPSPGAYLAELAGVYTLGEHVDAAAARPWLTLLAAIVGGGVLLTLWNGRCRRQPAACGLRPARSQGGSHTRPYNLFVLLWALLPLLLYYLVIRDRATFASRYISVALPGWLLLAGLALRGWARAGRPWGVAAALALVIALAPGLYGDLTDERFFHEDVRGLMAWLKAETAPDGPSTGSGQALILVDQRYPFGFYYERWNNASDGFPPAEPAALAPAQYLFVDVNTLEQRLTALAAGKERVFWVEWYRSDTDPRGAVDFLLRKFGTLLGERGFRGYRVRWYRIAPDTIFELAPPLQPLSLTFDGQVGLEGWACGGRGPGETSTVEETRAQEVPAGQPAWAVLRWRQLPGAARPLKASLRLVAEDGRLVGQDDRPLLNDRHLMLPHWGEQDRPLNVYLVEVKPDTPAGVYLWQIVVYDPETLAPLPWWDGEGQPGSGGPESRPGPATLGSIRVLGGSD